MGSTQHPLIVPRSRSKPLSQSAYWGCVSPRKALTGRSERPSHETSTGHHLTKWQAQSPILRSPTVGRSHIGTSHSRGVSTGPMSRGSQSTPSWGLPQHPWHGGDGYAWHGVHVPLARELRVLNGKGASTRPMVWGSQQIALLWCGMELPMAWAIQKAHGKGRRGWPCRIDGREQFGSRFRKFFQKSIPAQGKHVRTDLRRMHRRSRATPYTQRYSGSRRCREPQTTHSGPLKAIPRPPILYPYFLESII